MTRSLSIGMHGGITSIGQKLAHILVGGATISYSPSQFAQWLLQGNVGISTFGTTLLGAFSILRPDALEKLAQAKGRDEKKPFVIVTTRDHIDTLFAFGGLAKEITPATKKMVKNLLYQGSVTYPIGVLLPRNPHAHLPKRVCGFLDIDGVQTPTIGFMIAGKDKHLEDIINHLPQVQYRLAGTSANLSRIGKTAKDLRARGSGHHRIAGTVIDFGWNRQVSISIPDEHPQHARQTRTGMSTSTLYISPTGKKASLIREGSLSRHALKQLVKSVGIQTFTVNAAQVRTIEPYAYPKAWKDLFHNHGYRHANFLHQCIDYVIYKVKRNKTFTLPFFLRHLLPKPF